MNEHQHLPDFDRLSIVTAMVLLAYSLTAFIQLPERTLNIQLPGFLFVAKINFYTIVSILVAGLAAAGSDWVITSHPHLGEERRWHHWILPALTAMVIGVPLNEISVSAAWWIIFGLGSLLFVGVLVSEYISVDAADIRFHFASVGLTAVSLALFLILAIAVRGSGLRLYIVLSAVVPAIALLSARNLHLRMAGKWPLAWVGGIALIIGQLSICLFYLPIKPIQYGMILLALVYALISLAGNNEENMSPARIWIEPSLMFSAIFILSFIL